MKKPIAWHEECLHNQKAHVFREAELLEKQAAALAKTREDTYAYARQILRAKEDGLEEFDRERYLKKRKASSSSAANGGDK